MGNKAIAPHIISPLSHTLPLDDKEQDYFLLAQSPVSNKLQKKLTKQMKPAQLDLLGNGAIEEADFKLFICGYDELKSGVNQSAAMLLDALMIKATHDGLQSTLVNLPLKDYMAIRGLKDEKETRIQVKKDINALERVSFGYKGIGKNRGAWLKVSIAGGTVGQIKNGDIIFRFNQDFFDSFRVSDTNKYLYMCFPREALQGNIKHHPHTYWLGRKISEHKRMNAGKSNENIIGVKTLIEACPDFPTYEEVANGNRHLTERIIDPFERDMDVLSPSLKWEYTNAKEPPKDYKSFISSTVTICWEHYTDKKKLVAGKVERAKRQSNSKKKSSKADS